ncbi:preprotein translocase subunit SecG [Natranaerobius thermophilus]|uniref:Protein-export membrane protein SecG n=1 Tax=Natranaerobius thermophilus (strain ATCC BAA-1301 / DSM 18059 / JW/NM-WN-LF) TaxID=457570 RepID=B2A6Z0_NATTJ|nr:protein translocase subunit secG [Natranaerobius thermophilus JW/NM-WN-LF]
MLYSVLVGLHVIITLVLIATVLLQSGKSAGLSGAISGGAETVFGKKKGIDALLSKVTTVTAILFIVNSILLAALSGL